MKKKTKVNERAPKVDRRKEFIEKLRAATYSNGYFLSNQISYDSVTAKSWNYFKKTNTNWVKEHFKGTKSSIFSVKPSFYSEFLNKRYPDKRLHSNEEILRGILWTGYLIDKDILEEMPKLVLPSHIDRIALDSFDESIFSENIQEVITIEDRREYFESNGINTTVPSSCRSKFGSKTISEFYNSKIDEVDSNWPKDIAQSDRIPNALWAPEDENCHPEPRGYGGYDNPVDGITKKKFDLINYENKITLSGGKKYGVEKIGSKRGELNEK